MAASATAAKRTIVGIIAPVAGKTILGQANGSGDRSRMASMTIKPVMLAG